MTLTIEKPQAQSDPALQAQSPREYRWTVEAYYRAYEAGIFEDPKRLELIHGRIIRKMPQNARHASLRRRVSRRLRNHLEPALMVMEESPLRLALDGEPVPDIFVVIGAEGDYERHHPTQADAVLVVEVADSSVDIDTGGKAILYAQAGINDYWVVLVNDLAIVRHREPTLEGYKSVTRLAGTDTISPLAVSEVVWTISELLGNGENTNNTDG